MPSSPAPSTPPEGPTSNPATSVDIKDKMHTAPSTDKAVEGDVLDLVDSDSDEDAAMKDADKGKEKSKGTKRKGNDTPTSAPTKKKSKTSTSKSSPSTGGSKSKKASPPAGDDKEKKLVTLNLKTNKFDFKQKEMKASGTASYMRELPDFLDFVAKLFAEDKDAVLDEWPEEHHGIVAKLVHESTSTVGVVASQVRKTLIATVEIHLSGLEDSQEQGESGSVDERLPLAPLKSLISTLATRINYGLTASDLADAGIDLPEGVKDVHNGLQIWCWEVKDEGLLGSEVVGRYEKRRAEREEAKAECLALLKILTPEQQAAVLSKSKPSLNDKAEPKSTPAAKEKKPVESASAAAKAKGKVKAKSDAEGEEEEEEPKEEGEDDEVMVEEGKGKKPAAPPAAPKPKKAKKEKVLTEEEKAEKEEKERKKAEEAAEKEAKKQERLAAKAERDAVKAEKDKKKREKEEAEEKKEQLKKKQSNAFASFFTKTSPIPEAGPSKASSTIPAKSTAASSAATAAASSSASKPKKDGFDYVFHPFTVRPNVELAKVCRDSEKEGKSVKISEDGDLDASALLSQYKSSFRPSSVLTLSSYPSPPIGVRKTVEQISSADVTNNDASVFLDLLNDRKKVQVKVLKFADDVRPGYVGTWTKTSRVVGFRTPFARESALLNYDYDSEVEWEDEPEGEGEDLGGLGDDDSDKDDDERDSDADSWLAEDDEIEFEEGYDEEGDLVMMDAEGRGGGAVDSDIEIVMDEAEEKRRREKERQRKKRKAEKDNAPRGKRRNAPLPPIIKGLAWEDEEGISTEPLFAPMKAVFLNDAHFGLNPFTFVSKPFTTSSSTSTSHPSGSSSSTAKGKGKENTPLASSSAPPPPPLERDPITGKLPAAPHTSSPSTVQTVPAGTINLLKPKRPSPSKPFPADLMPRFILAVHGSTDAKALVIGAFVKGVQAEGRKDCTKAATEAKWSEVVVKVGKKQCVREEVRREFGVAVEA
ncbi:hypothetical protein JCM8547_004595 [Rhodosporidiobolus lusitaniae]